VGAVCFTYYYYLCLCSTWLAQAGAAAQGSSDDAATREENDCWRAVTCITAAITGAAPVMDALVKMAHAIVCEQVFSSLEAKAQEKDAIVATKERVAAEKDASGAAGKDASGAAAAAAKLRSQAEQYREQAAALRSVRERVARGDPCPCGQGAFVSKQCQDPSLQCLAFHDAIKACNNGCDAKTLWVQSRACEWSSKPWEVAKLLLSPLGQHTLAVASAEKCDVNQFNLLRTWLPMRTAAVDRLGWKPTDWDTFVDAADTRLRGECRNTVFHAPGMRVARSVLEKVARMSAALLEHPKVQGQGAAAEKCAFIRRLAAGEALTAEDRALARRELEESLLARFCGDGDVTTFLGARGGTVPVAQDNATRAEFLTDTLAWAMATAPAGSGNPPLWLRWCVGAHQMGKSWLAAALGAQWCLDKHSGTPVGAAGGLIVARCHFAVDTAETADADRAIRALARQVAHRSTGFREALLRVLLENRSLVDGGSRPGLGDLFDMCIVAPARQAATGDERVLLVIDAVDEASATSRDFFCDANPDGQERKFADALAELRDTWRVVVFATLEPRAGGALAPCVAQLDPEEQGNERDVAHVAREFVAADPTISAWPAGKAQQLADAVIEGSRGRIGFVAFVARLVHQWSGSTVDAGDMDGLLLAVEQGWDGVLSRYLGLLVKDYRGDAYAAHRAAIVHGLRVAAGFFHRTSPAVFETLLRAAPGATLPAVAEALDALPNVFEPPHTEGPLLLAELRACIGRGERLKSLAASFGTYVAAKADRRRNEALLQLEQILSSDDMAPAKCAKFVATELLKLPDDDPAVLATFSKAAALKQLLVGLALTVHDPVVETSPGFAEAARTAFGALAGDDVVGGVAAAVVVLAAVEGRKSGRDLLFRTIDDAVDQRLPIDMADVDDIVWALHPGNEGVDTAAACELVEILQRLENADAEVGPRTRLSVMHTCARSSSPSGFDGAIDILATMRAAGQLGGEDGRRAYAISFNALARTAGALGNVVYDRLDNLFAAAKGDGEILSTYAYNSAINVVACAKDVKLDVAFEAQRAMEAAGVRGNEVTYNALINACAQNGDVDRAFEAQRAMEAAGVRGNEVTYNALINACAKGGDVDRAFEAQRAMEAAGVRGNEVTYNALINACAKGGDVDRAFEAQRAMEAAGVRGNEVTYSTLINACAQNGDVERAFEAQRAMEAAGFRGNEVTYSTLINACAKGGDKRRIWTTLAEMVSHDLSPNARTFGPIMAFYARRANVRDIFALLHDMTATYGVHANLFCLNCALTGAVKARDRRAGEKIVGLMTHADADTLRHARRFRPWIDISHLPPPVQGRGRDGGRGRGQERGRGRGNAPTQP
jgi:pentatricopeptide repeat protein